MTTTTSIQWQLAARPVGEPTADDVRRVEVELPELADGEVRVQNAFLSVDPYMRGRMNDVKSYVPPFALDETMTGGAVGEVVESRSDDLPVGTVVLHDLGWRDVVPRVRAASSARRTWPEISSSPMTTDSRPELTANKCSTTSSPVMTRTLSRRSSGSTPLAVLMVSIVASTARALPAVRGSSTSR